MNNTINNTEDLNLAYLKAILTAYQDGKLASEDDEKIELCLIEALDRYGFSCGSDLVNDWDNGTHANERLLRTVINSRNVYPDFNEPLVNGDIECYWILDNDGSDTGLETYSYESDWFKRMIELYYEATDRYDMQEFTDAFDLAEMVKEYDLEVFEP